MFGEKMVKRIALWTPLPPLKSGIANYIVPLLPYIAQNRDLEIFIDDNYIPAQSLSNNYNIYTFHEYQNREAYKTFDLNIYQMGNNEFHLYLYNQILKTPGLVVNHDLSISMILYHYYAGLLNNFPMFRAEFKYSEGEEATRKLDKIVAKGDNEELFTFFASHYMMRRISERSLAVATFTEYTTNILREKYGCKRGYSIHQFVPDPYEEEPQIDTEKIRLELGLPTDKMIIGVFGFLQKNKQISVILRAYARLLKNNPQSMLVFVGEINSSGGYEEYLNRLIDDLGLKGKMLITGYTDDQAFNKFKFAVDVIVSLRWPSYGQMSATIPRSIATGKPLIISDIPEWRGFSEDFCWRVNPLDHEGEQLEQYLQMLYNSSDLIKKRGESARKYFKENMSPDEVGKQFSSMIQEVCEQKDNLSTLLVDYQPIQKQKITHADNQGQTHLVDFSNNSYNPTDDSRNSEDYSPLENVVQAFGALEAARNQGKTNRFAQRIKNIPLIGRFLYAGMRFIQVGLTMNAVRSRQYWYETSINDILTRQYQRLTGLERKVNKVSFLFEEIHPPPPIYEDPVNIVKVIDDASKFGENFLSGLSAETILADRYNILHHRVFRGAREDIKQKLERLFESIPLYDNGFPYVDLGCGTGELLELFKERGVRAIGIDTNSAYIQDLQNSGYSVVEDEALSFLENQKKESIQGITAIHLLEHMSMADVLRFGFLAYEKLVIGGMVVLQSPNPYCTSAMSTFYSDPTHNRPLVPDYMIFILKYVGFDDVRLLFTEPLESYREIIASNIRGRYRDFTVIGKK